MNASVYALLPALARFSSLMDLAKRLTRADIMEPGAANELAAGSCFQWPGSALPVAALIREHAAHDAGSHTWMCADLAHVEPDMTGVRMLACGSLDVSREEAEALAAPLRPLFGDSGMPLETTLPTHWHVRLPPQSPVPALDPPGLTLGDDLIRHLPAGDAGKRWRQILNETQIILHQHPLNRERAGQGKQTINSLWLWGAGSLPAWVKSDVEHVYGDDLLLAALAAKAGVTVHPLADFQPSQKVTTDTLLDLGRSQDPAACCELLFDLLDGRRADTLILHFAGGERWSLRRGQRWRFWRRRS